MLPPSRMTPDESPPIGGRVHIVGAGPVGLLMAALLQSSNRFSVHLYEKRREYTRTRMVQLAPYLVADSLASYRADDIDADNVEAIFELAELTEGLAYRQSLPPDLGALLQRWALGFCPLNDIERGLSDLIDARQSRPVRRTTAVLTADQALALAGPGDVLIDCTGSQSLLRDRLVPPSDEVQPGANTLNIRLEYALVVTFLYGQHYACNEYCKYYKNAENPLYKFIPAVHRTCYDGSITHVTGIVNITALDYEAMPPRFDGPWLRDHFPGIADSMDRFIAKIRQETHGELLGELEIIRIPLNLYRARNATSRRWHTAGVGNDAFPRAPVFLVGDSAIGSPYFQSISLGFECAMFLARLLQERGTSPVELLERYELFTYKQWLRVYTRSKMIKHNKDLLECIDDPLGLLDKLHIY